MGSVKSSEVDPRRSPGWWRRRSRPRVRHRKPATAHRRCRAPAPRPDWDAPVPTTGTDVFADVARSLADGFDGADRLYGFARHELDTTFVGTSTGLRRRFTQPTGSVEINAKRDDASAWVGAAAPDFVECRPIPCSTSCRPGWTGRGARSNCRRPLRDADAAVNGRRHDDLPEVDHGRPRRSGGPHRAVGAGWRHAGGGAAHRARA